MRRDELFTAIYRAVEPAASEAYRRLVEDHGENFAEIAREIILLQKQLDWSEPRIH